MRQLSDKIDYERQQLLYIIPMMTMEAGLYGGMAMFHEGTTLHYMQWKPRNKE